MNISQYTIYSSETILSALISLNKLKGDSLTLFVVDKNLKVVGTITDGDIRRALIKGISTNDKVENAMNSNFRFFRKNNIGIKEFHDCKAKGIILMPVLNEDNKIDEIINLNCFISKLPIDAVLMAGGKGERLRPLTNETPKPLLKVGNKSIIDYNIDSLISYGIENISVTVNYLKEQIEEHFTKSYKGIKINCVREPKFLGTIGSIKFVDKFHNDTILVMNSDIFTNINFEEFYLEFKEQNADMAVACAPYTISVPYGIFDVDGNEIKGIKEKPTYNYYINAGIYLIKKDLLNKIPDNEFFNATDFMDKLITEGFKVVKFPIIGYWLDIGKMEEYSKAKELVKHIFGSN
ncbi:MAG: nucleotidyltransferase family protein [Bacteroidales bacterium]|nr:nucleotidyltransferase family protein [Bacteroidales bacterium]